MTSNVSVIINIEYGKCKYMNSNWTLKYAFDKVFEDDIFNISSMTRSSPLSYPSQHGPA